VSSIRLFLLDAFERRGEMHGHQIRLLADEEHVHLWTDISVGSLYGAIKRLAAEGLVEVVRSERAGNFPERHVYAITEAGRRALRILRDDGLAAITLRPDPFDLALTRLDVERLDELRPTVEARISRLHGMLRETIDLNQKALPFLSVAETHAMRHREHRLRSEISWHEHLLADLPAVTHDELVRAAS
jgi:DNA-binding PadR family transcriptional regulator